MWTIVWVLFIPWGAQEVTFGFRSSPFKMSNLLGPGNPSEDAAGHKLFFLTWAPGSKASLDCIINIQNFYNFIQMLRAEEQCPYILLL